MHNLVYQIGLGKNCWKKIYDGKKVSYWKIFKENKKFKKNKIYNYKNLLKAYMSKKELELFIEEGLTLF